VTDFVVPVDLPLGPFEGTRIQVFAAKGKNSRLHASETCSQLRSPDVRALTIGLERATVERMCRQCAMWGAWTRPGSALGIFLDQVSGLGLAYQLSRYASPDEDDFQAEEVMAAARILRADQDDDDEAEDRWQERYAAKQMRDSDLPDRLWSAAKSLHQAWMVIERYPWLEPWAHDALADKAAYVEGLRRDLAQLLDPEALLEASAVFALPPSPLSAGDAVYRVLGDERTARQVLDGMQRDWRKSVVSDWTGFSVSRHSSHQRVRDALGRKRKGVTEVYAAIDALVTGWIEEARQQIAASVPDQRLIVLVIPTEDLDPRRRSRQGGWRSLLWPWQLGVLCCHAVAVDWARRRALVRVPDLIAQRLLAEETDFAVAELEDPGHGYGDVLAAWVDEHMPRGDGVLLPGVLDDGPVAERRPLTTADIMALRSEREDEGVYVVFSASGGFEAVPLQVLAERCKSGWRGILVAGADDLPSALMAPWAEQVASVDTESSASSWARPEPGDESFGFTLSVVAGEKALERPYAFGFQSVADSPREVSRCLGLLAIARGVHDLRTLAQRYDRQALPPVVWEALLAFDRLDLTPFRTTENRRTGTPGLGLPLGVLAHVQIYTSNSDPDYGKGHAASCRHVRDGGIALHPGDDLITAADLVEGQFDWCSKCGGYAVRRLTDAQLAHYRAAHRLQRINDEIGSEMAYKQARADEITRLLVEYGEELKQLASWNPSPTQMFSSEQDRWREVVRGVEDSLHRLVRQREADLADRDTGQILSIESGRSRSRRKK
jgi:uncharacterized protein YukE